MAGVENGGGPTRSAPDPPEPRTVRTQTTVSTAPADAPYPDCTRGHREEMLDSRRMIRQLTAENKRHTAELGVAEGIITPLVPGESSAKTSPIMISSLASFSSAACAPHAGASSS